MNAFRRESAGVDSSSEVVNGFVVRRITQGFGSELNT
jgi:hypothetical protein